MYKVVLVILLPVTSVKGSIKLAVACGNEIIVIDRLFHNDIMENLHHCSFT